MTVPEQTKAKPGTLMAGQDPVSQLIKIYARIERRRRQQLFNQEGQEDPSAEPSPRPGRGQDHRGDEGEDEEDDDDGEQSEDKDDLGVDTDREDEAVGADEDLLEDEEGLDDQKALDDQEVTPC